MTRRIWILLAIFAVGVAVLSIKIIRRGEVYADMAGAVSPSFSSPAASESISAANPVNSASGKVETKDFFLDQVFLSSTNIPSKDYKYIPPKAQIGIYYPQEYSRDKTYPVFVAEQPDVGNFIPGMSAYQRFADELGFIITAQNIDPKFDDEAFGRYYYILASLDYLKKQGVIGDQPVWIGGASGGAKWAMHLGEFGGNIFSAVLAIVANDDFSSYGYGELPNPTAKDVAIYLLNGTHDDIAGPQDKYYQDMLVSLRKNGFWNVTVKIFEGGHEIPYNETKQAFERFIKAGKRL